MFFFFRALFQQTQRNLSKHSSTTIATLPLDEVEFDDDSLSSHYSTDPSLPTKKKLRFALKHNEMHHVPKWEEVNMQDMTTSSCLCWQPQELRNIRDNCQHTVRMYEAQLDKDPQVLKRGRRQFCEAVQGLVQASNCILWQASPEDDDSNDDASAWLLACMDHMPTLRGLEYSLVSDSAARASQHRRAVLRMQGADDTVKAISCATAQLAMVRAQYDAQQTGF